MRSTVPETRTDEVVTTRAGILSEVFCSAQGEGPYVGRRHVFVRLAGCAVGCRFCDTPESLRPVARFAVRDAGEPVHGDNPVDPARAAAIVREVVGANAPVHAISITGGEPLEQVDFLSALLPRLRDHRRLLETSGTLPDALSRVIDHVDIVSMDLKLPSVARTPDHFDHHRRFLCAARAREVYIKVVVSDRVDADEWGRACALVAELAPRAPFIVQPETDRAGGLAIDAGRLTELARVASRHGLDDVRVLPQVHKFLGAP